MANYYKPIPGFKCIEYKHSVQKKIYQKTKDLGVEKIVEYFQEHSKKDPLFKKMKTLKRKKLH